MKKRFLLVSCLTIFFQSMFGQEIRLFTGKPFITLDEQLQLILIVTGEPLPSSPVFPEMDGFSKISANVQTNIRGQGREIHYIQSYYPLKTGKFTVLPFEVMTRSGVKYTRKLLIEVEKPSILYKFENITTDATVSLVFDRDTCFVGEQITAEIRATISTGKEKFLRFLPISMEDIAEKVNLNGLRIEGVSNPAFSPPVQTEGKTQYTLAKLYFFPTQPGNFTIHQLQLQTEQDQVARNTTATDRKKGLNRRVTMGQISVPPASFFAKPLPETDLTKAPASGVFSIFHEISRKEYTTGEAVRLEIVVTGTGNPEWVKSPIMPDNEQLVYFNPVVNTSREFFDSAIVSRKQFVYEIIPAYPGAYNLGPVLFYYFNTNRRAYDSLEISIIPLSVSGNEIPQLMEANALNHFYDYAFKQASETPISAHPRISWLVLGLLFLSGTFLIVSAKWY